MKLVHSSHMFSPFVGYIKFIISMPNAYNKNYQIKLLIAKHIKYYNYYQVLLTFMCSYIILYTFIFFKVK